MMISQVIDRLQEYSVWEECWGEENQLFVCGERDFGGLVESSGSFAPYLGN